MSVGGSSDGAQQPGGLSSVASSAKAAVGLLQAGGIIWGYLAGLAKSSESIYNPLDTAFFFVFSIALMLYVVTFGVGLVLGIIASMNKGDLPTWVLVPAGLLIVVVAIPGGLSVANGWVQGDPLDAIGITFVRFVGVGLTVFAGYLVWRFTVKRQG